MSEQYLKSGRGGARAGAGRKATGRLVQFASTTISAVPEKMAELKACAKENNMSTSAFVFMLFDEWKQK